MVRETRHTKAKSPDGHLKFPAIKQEKGEDSRISVVVKQEEENRDNTSVVTIDDDLKVAGKKRAPTTTKATNEATTNTTNEVSTPVAVTPTKKVKKNSMFSSIQSDSGNILHPHFLCVKPYHGGKEVFIGVIFKRKFIPTPKTYGSFVMHDAIIKRDLWAVDYYPLGFSYHKNGKVVKSFPGSSYSTRFHLMHSCYEFDDEEEMYNWLKAKAIEIRNNVNKKCTDVESKLTVADHPTELFTILEDTVLSDVIGVQKGTELLLAMLGDNYVQGSPEWFERNKDKVYAVFKPGNIPASMARYLGCSAADVSTENVEE